MHLIGNQVITQCPPLFVVSGVQAVMEFRSAREIDNIPQIRAEQDEIHPMSLGIALKRQIARHLKLLKASVPNLPTCTCDSIQDLPL